MVLATKFEASWIENRGSRAELIRSVEASLRALDTDWIELLQLHAPDAGADRSPRPSTPWAGLVRTGKVRYIGCSNFSGWMIADAAWPARPLPRHAVHLGAEPVEPPQPGDRR